jgi:tetratricopeptide (TPR) repeat protein
MERLLSENHRTVPYISLYNGLKFIFSAYQLPREVFIEGLHAIDGHMSRISTRYGISGKTPESTINDLGYHYLRAGENRKAISVFLESTERYPGSANTFDSLGEAYERSGDLKKAEASYKKACELGVQTMDRNYSLYKQNLQRVQKAMD